jgi:ATPase components of ABC transporters with duplicated ATPase domains
MLQAINIGLRYGKRVLFEGVNLKFENNNCYGLIGANGSGKTTFLKILSGEIDSTSGEIAIGKGERMSTLVQNHHAYDENNVIETVIMGDDELYKIMKEKDELYMKTDFSNEDGIRVGILEDLFLKKNGWQAESDAAILLSGLGIGTELQNKTMGELKESEKVKVLLARALFGEPDILLLDEPTNGLDLESKRWLEEFLIDFKNTVIVISHDRHFLNKICTHVVDIDYEKITMFAGNYDFWYESSQLIQRQMRDSNKKKEEKMAELQDFIRRFSANASKSKQATSRKKSLEKIVLDDIKPSSRKYPFINFEPERSIGKEVIHLDHVYKSIDGTEILNNIRLTIKPGDKIALIGNNEVAKSMLLRILASKDTIDSGEVKVGSTVITSHYPKNYDDFFQVDLNMIEWLKQYSTNQEDTFVRSFLGRMLFSGEETLKKVNVLSGGEKVRCMLSKMMLEHGNVLLLDEPTNHLDMESITALDEGLQKFNGCLVFSSYDQHLIETIATRIIDIKEDGTYVDKEMTYEEYLSKYGNK